MVGDDDGQSVCVGVINRIVRGDACVTGQQKFCAVINNRFE
jgi:hypothetical protein